MLCCFVTPLYYLYSMFYFSCCLYVAHVCLYVVLCAFCVYFSTLTATILFIITTIVLSLLPMERKRCISLCCLIYFYGLRYCFAFSVWLGCKLQILCLDYFLVPNSLTDIVRTIDIKPGYRSDHSIVEMQINTNKFVQGSGI